MGADTATDTSISFDMGTGKMIHLLYPCTFHIIEFEFQNEKILIELWWKKYIIND